MCMFCVIQKWSRRVATMLPWLVIPLIGLWALSQLLPPAFRFEITSPRLACVSVLLVTLFWYEVLMPQLSVWRVRRNVMLRERKRIEALELQKMKKTATRKCRNCLTPYKDQNPGGGKFMCSYCGHVSKRPVLDLPVPPGMSNSGLIKELFGNVSLCNHEWLENGNWVVNGSFPVDSSYPQGKTGVTLFGVSEPCLPKKYCSGVYFFVCKLLMSLFMSVRWLWRKLFQISSLEDFSSDANHRMLAKKGVNDGTGPESRSEKARRKAEEKRQARLEKELLEEEERKQREEVAKLVKERRRLRDEKLEAENRARGASSPREKDSKKEAERRKQEFRKVKVKVYGKSNSDVDEFDRKLVKEHERKRDAAKKSENDRSASPKIGVDSVKVHATTSGHQAKGNSPNSFSQGNVGSRYFDRMKGTFLSSSKALTDSGLFGKAAPTLSPASKEVNPDGAIDYSSFPNSKFNFHSVECLPGKITMTRNEKVIICPVAADIQASEHKTTQMSWHQLFVRSSPVNSNVISRPSAPVQSKFQSESSNLPGSISSVKLYDNPIDLPSPFRLPSFSSDPLANCTTVSEVKTPLFPRTSDRPQCLLPEEPDLLEDPCYVPDPVSLLGPVSESLDNFQLDRAGSYVHHEFMKLNPAINVSSPKEVVRPSPIKSPLSRLRVADEQNCSSHFFGSPKVLDLNSLSAAEFNNHKIQNEMRTWHMWTSSPLVPDGLSLIGSTTNWITSTEKSRLNNVEMMHLSPQKHVTSFFSNDGHIVSSQKTALGNAQNSNGFCSPIPSSNDQDPWLQKAFFPPLSASENHISISPTDGASQKKMACRSPGRSVAYIGADPSTSKCLSKNEWSGQDSGEGVENLSAVRPVGSLYSTPVVRSSWSCE